MRRYKKLLERGEYVYKKKSIYPGKQNVLMSGAAARTGDFIKKEGKISNLKDIMRVL